MRAAARRARDLGLRYVFPIHLKTNGFGGAALYNLLAGGERYDCKHYGQDCNAQGLTEQGALVMKELMKRGVIIDVGHMSAKALGGAKRSDLEPIYRSSDYMTVMWENAIVRGAGIK
jgi:microsomal dipeptidase-like Zn-dependent dipeptidase